MGLLQLRSLIRERSGRAFSPVIRSFVLGAPFLFPVLASMRGEALARGARPVPAPYLLASLALLLSLASFLGGWYLLVTFLAVGPLALAQSRFNELHSHMGLDPSVNGRFSLVNLLFMVLGGSLLAYTCWPLVVWLVRVVSWYLGGRGAT